MLKIIIYKIERVVKRLLISISYLLILLLRVTGIKIKFCPIIYTRIGHLAANTELFLRRLNAGYFDKGYKYVGVSGKPCNHQLLIMIKRELPIIESRLFSGIIKASIFQNSNFFQDTPFNSNEYYEFNNLPGVIKFTMEEKKRGLRELEKIGIGPQDWFVCFHNRTSEYLKREQGFQDWSHHDYRDCSISNFLPAMEYITSLGGYAIRMGHHMNEELKSKNSKIIDYASYSRSDFMDIYLSAHCKFFVGCTAGLHIVPMIFNVPIIMTNTAHIELPAYRKGDLFIPKKIRNVKENRLITFKEIFDKRIGAYLHASQFIDEGLEMIENSSDEILDVTVEMNSILDSSYKYTEDDDFLQKAFWSLTKPDNHCHECPARIGRCFLMENKYLLGGY